MYTIVTIKSLQSRGRVMNGARKVVNVIYKTLMCEKNCKLIFIPACHVVRSASNE